MVKRISPKIAYSIIKNSTSIITQKMISSNMNKSMIKTEYLMKLRNIIENKKVYPILARDMKEQGSVLITFEIQENGCIENINIKQPSSSRKLNYAAVKLLEDISTFDPIPKELGKSKWVIEVPINYTIVNI